MIIEKAAKKLSEDKCFLSDHQQLFSTFKIATDESLMIWEEFSPILSGYNGNAEKFYSEFYKFCLLGKHMFTKIPCQLSALLCSEIANLCLQELCNDTENGEVDFTVDLTEKDVYNILLGIASELCTHKFVVHGYGKVIIRSNVYHYLQLLNVCDNEQSLVNIKN